MPDDSIGPKAIAIVAAVFAILIAVLLIWGGSDEGMPSVQPEAQVSTLRIGENGQAVEVPTPSAPAGEETQQLTDDALRLLQQGSPNERRSTAIQLAYLLGDAETGQRMARLDADRRGRLREALIAGLKGSDDTVARTCAEALLGLWQTASTEAATRHLRRAITALEEGKPQDAAAMLAEVEKLGGALPPDFYRIRAEALLASGDAKAAFDDCHRALNAEPAQFAALETMARAFVQSGQRDQAVAALDRALALYPTFPAAVRLRAQLTATGR